MDEKDLEHQASPEDPGAPEETPDTRSTWQRNKEELYDKVPMTVKQLDVIIALGWIGLAVVAVLIVLEATGVM